ncbi:MAG TPA: zf-HC2 domain-containing protein [Anaeromyxobacteraceae bacterium]|nr:zf-HC2 domain-containing protein [Anaeromyxobacteraceae bacterium]
MNPCLRFAPMIGARPGELPDEDARALAEHLAACSACRARAADGDTLAALLSQALLAEANARDFSTFSDEVLARIPAYRDAAAGRRGTSARPTDGFWAWIRHHRFATAMGTLVPALAAVAIVIYVGRGEGPGPDDVLVQVTAEGSATVLDTSDGPVVLFGEDEPAGT